MSSPQEPHQQDGVAQQHPGPAEPPGAVITDPGPERPAEPPPGVPPVASRRRMVIALAVVVAVLGLAVAGVFYWKAQTTDTANAEVGDCIQVTNASRDRAATQQIDCDAPQAGYRVTAVGDGARCDDSEDTFTQDGTTVCLRLNLDVGDCAKIRDTPSGSVERVDCAAATAGDVELVRLDTTTGSSSACDDGQVPLALASRSITYCFGSPAQLRPPG